MVRIAWPAPANGTKTPKSAVIVFPGAAAGGGDVSFTASRSGTGAVVQAYRCPVVVSFGQHNLVVHFLSGSNGTGTEVATASGTVIATSTGALNLSTGAPMNPISFVNGVNTLSILPGQVATVGQPYSIQFSAQDVNGNLVAVPDSSAMFSIVQGSDAVINSAGNLVAGLAGFVSVQATVGNITSAAVQITVNSPVAVLRQLNQNSNSILVNPKTGMLWASVPSVGGSYGNQVIQVNPATGAILGGIFAGSEPGPLALSSDASTLYVGLSGADAIQPILTAGPTLGTQFALTPPQSPFTNSPASQIVVQPGAANTVVVARQGGYPLGLEMYIGGSEAANNLDGSQSVNPVFVSPSELFCISGFGGLLDVASDSQGLSQLNSYDLLNNSSTSVSLLTDSGRIYASDGSVIDVTTKTRIGEFDLSSVSSQSTSAASFTVDGANHRIFFITAGTFNYPYILSAFDTRTFLPIASVNLPNLSFSNTNTADTPCLTRFGAKGLAFRTDTAIYFLDHAPGL